MVIILEGRDTNAWKAYDGCELFDALKLRNMHLVRPRIHGSRPGAPNAKTQIPAQLNVG